MADYTLSKNVAGSSMNNERSRNIAEFFTYISNTHKTITSITRKGGVWCNCGGSSQNVTLSVYDQLLNSDELIKTSNTVTCKCYGTGPSNDNYATTTFSNWTQAESNAAIAAWAAGTLEIKRFVSVKAYTSSAHGSPTFRDGYYNDTINIIGTTVPFTNYKPVIGLFDVFRSNDGVTENPESTSVYAKISLTMTDTTGLSDNPQLLVYYSAEKDPSSASNYLNIGSAFGISSASNLNTTKTIRLTGTWNNGADYYFALYFACGEEVADARIDVALRATVPLFINENNNGVAIGQYSTATSTKAKFESRWRAYLYGGIEIVDGGAYEEELAFDSNAKFKVNTSNPLQPTLRCFGHVVEIHGEIQPTANIAGSTTYYPICTLPEKYAPDHSISVIQQGSNQSVWMLRIFERNHSEYPCKVMFARYRSGDSWAAATTSVWLPFHATWIVSGIMDNSGGDSGDEDNASTTAILGYGVLGKMILGRT